MDTLNQYKQIAHTILHQVYELSKNITNTEVMISEDWENGQFMILTDRWQEHRRYYGVLVHIEVKSNQKVYLRFDGTDLKIGQDLVDAGIPKQNLVVGFHQPGLRKYTDFATE